MSGPRPTPEAIGRLVAARPLKELARVLAETRAATASGLWGSSLAAVVAAVETELRRPVVVVCGHLDEADDLADDLELFVGRRPDVLPALELGGTLGRVSEEQVSNRLQLVSRYASSVPSDTILVAPVQSLMQPVPSKKQLAHLIRTLKPGDELEPEKLIVWLAEHGYNRLDQCEVPGDFAVRGGIIDVYLPGDFDTESEIVGLTARVDFFGDQIESIKRFDLDTLGSGEALESVRLIDLKGNIDHSESTSLFSYLPDDAIIVLWAPLEIAEQAKSYLDRLPEVKGIYPLSAVLKLAEPFARLELSQFAQGTVSMPSLVKGQEVPHVALPITSLQRFETEAKKAVTELAELTETHDVTVFCENEGERTRFVELIEMEKPGLAAKVDVPVGYLHRGFVWDPPRHVGGTGTLSPSSAITSSSTATNSGGASRKLSRRAR